MPDQKVAAIVAMDEARLIGANGALPWHLPEDLAYFKARTSGHVVVMGRKTWQSLPPRFAPLPGRTNIVVSRHLDSLNLPQGVIGASSVSNAIERGRAVAKPDQIIWIIGGAQVYADALPVCDEVYLTLVDGRHEGDAFLPLFEEHFAQVSAERGRDCTFKVYQRKRATN